MCAFLTLIKMQRCLGMRRWAVGGVMRDDVGDVLVATCCCWDGGLKVVEAEVMVARHANKIAIEAGLSYLVLRSDC